MFAMKYFEYFSFCQAILIWLSGVGIVKDLYDFLNFF